MAIGVQNNGGGLTVRVVPPPNKVINSSGKNYGRQPVAQGQTLEVNRRKHRPILPEYRLVPIMSLD